MFFCSGSALAILSLLSLDFLQLLFPGIHSEFLAGIEGGDWVQEAALLEIILFKRIICSGTHVEGETTMVVLHMDRQIVTVFSGSGELLINCYSTIVMQRRVSEINSSDELVSLKIVIDTNFGSRIWLIVFIHHRLAFVVLTSSLFGIIEVTGTQDVAQSIVRRLRIFLKLGHPFIFVISLKVGAAEL